MIFIPITFFILPETKVGSYRFKNTIKPYLSDTDPSEEALIFKISKQEFLNNASNNSIL